MIIDSLNEKVSLQRKFKRTYQRSLIWIIGRLMPLRYKDRPDATPKNILILVQEKLGDAILTTPLFKNLKILFPDIQIHLVIFHKASSIFDEDPNIFKVHNYKKDKVGVIRHLKKMNFDVLFNTKDHPSMTFILLCRYLNATYKVGIDHVFHRNHFHHLLHVDFMAHIVEKNCSLLFNLSSSAVNFNLKPYIPPKKISSDVATFVEKMPAHTITGINLSAGSREKEWPIEKWKRLIDSLHEVFILFAVGDRIEDKKQLESEYQKVLKSPDTQSINDAAAMVKKLKMLITPSTGLLHVASCFEVKVVGLYRHDPSDHLRFSPYMVRYRKVIADDHRVSHIPVADVLTSARELLNESDINLV
jgi:ADP-heptose:LPS heptosyltransferase